VSTPKSISTTQPFDKVAEVLDVDILSHLFAHEPAEQSRQFSARIKLTAKLLAKAIEIPHSKALEAVAQAVRFRTWHDLSSHLAEGEEARPASLPKGWLDALSSAVVLRVLVEDEVSMPQAQLIAFEQLGQTLAMLTDTPTQVVLDGVSAKLCGARTWVELRARSPLKAQAPLYRFVSSEDGERGDSDEPSEFGGYFKESPACRQLTDELDEHWQGYDNFTKSDKRRARQWVETALSSQPGFLEGGLSLAWMQYEAGETDASSTVNRFIKQAEALISAGYKGSITWSHLGNRFYHRLLWLRLKLHSEAGDFTLAARLARKQLKLNPNDNLGVRFVLPLILIEQGEYVAAHRAMQHLDGDRGTTASAIRAFNEFTLDNHALFRRELATALFTLPWLRVFLLSQRTPLPDDDDGFRGIHPEIETFTDFALPALIAVPGLRAACKAFLAEPEVLKAETELRRYWQGYWGKRDGSRTGSSDGWNSLLQFWIDRASKSPFAQL